jgi:hypothetical protein
LIYAMSIALLLVISWMPCCVTTLFTHHILAIFSSYFTIVFIAVLRIKFCKYEFTVPSLLPKNWWMNFCCIKFNTKSSAVACCRDVRPPLRVFCWCLCCYLLAAAAAAVVVIIVVVVYNSNNEDEWWYILILIT